MMKAFCNTIPLPGCEINEIVLFACLGDNYSVKMCSRVDVDVLQKSCLLRENLLACRCTSEELLACSLVMDYLNCSA